MVFCYHYFLHSFLELFVGIGWIRRLITTYKCSKNRLWSAIPAVLNCLVWPNLNRPLLFTVPCSYLNRWYLLVRLFLYGLLNWLLTLFDAHRALLWQPVCLMSHWLDSKTGGVPRLLLVNWSLQSLSFRNKTSSPTFLLFIQMLEVTVFGH